MSEPSSIIDVYQLHVWLREITPLIGFVNLLYVKLVIQREEV